MMPCWETMVQLPYASYVNVTNFVPALSYTPTTSPWIYFTTAPFALQDKRNRLLSRVVFVVDFPEKIVRKKNYFSALLRGLFCCFLAE